MEEHQSRRGHVWVVLAALCFGATFPVTKEVLSDAGPYAIVAIRFGAGGLALWPYARRRRAVARERTSIALCAAALFTGYIALTVGLQTTTSTAAAFITYLLVVIVPVLSAVLLRRPPSLAVGAGIVLATTGLFLLGGEGLALGTGEALVLACAFAFAVHIILLGAAAERVDVYRLCAFQLVIVGFAAAVPAIARAEFSELSPGSWAACLLLAAAGTAGLLLQIVGQRSVSPTRTSLLLMVEPVVAAVGGYMIGERIPALGFAGAGLILIGILVSELPLDRSP